jgi:ferredoxin-thioredoxin reductase catalytic subunit
MGLFDGDPTCRFCRKETETAQDIICSCEVLARQRYNVFGNLFVEPKEISTASAKDLSFYIKRHRVAESELKEHLRVAQ